MDLNEACLDHDTLAAYVDGLLAAEAVDRADRHIDSCRDCRNELSALALVRTERSLPSGEADAAVGLTPPAIGRYVVMRELGRGAMGVVVRAYDPELARGVAVKIAANVSDGERTRLRTEAQAMARLTHPNVVTVYDVLANGDAICVAMELVDGTTLRGYLRTPRPWRDILDTCIRAGRGLAAAHAAQLIHRDFKPENVLCSRDGRVLVTDFGLARAIDAIEAPTTIAGTPAYLAPELYRGEPATPASDQFAFCVATFEALYGERPFTGANRSELRERILAGEPRKPPADTKVPAYVHAALLRGLARDPRGRYPSMTDLLDALARDPNVRRRRIAIAAGGLAAAAIAGAIAVRATDPSDAPTCDPSSLAGAWDAGKRAEVERALAAAQRPGLVVNVDAALDAYAASWLATRREACEATRVRGEQSEQILDQRMACLDGRRNELSELTDLLAQADSKLAARALDTVYRLHQPASCTAAAVRAVPDDPVNRPVLDLLRANLDRAWVLYIAGKAKQADVVAVDVADRARQLDSPWLLAEALLLRGRVANILTKFDAGEKVLYEALTAAERAHRDQLSAQIWIEIVENAGSQAHRFDVALANLKAADAALARVDANNDTVARYAYTVGAMLLARGRIDEARPRLEQALALATTDNLTGDRGAVHAALCGLERVARRFEVARKHCAAALPLIEGAYGSTDRRVAIACTTFGALELDERHWAAARAMFTRSTQIFEANHATSELNYALAVSNIGATIASQNDRVHASEYFARARDLFAAHHPDHPQRVIPLQGLANAASDRGDYATAIASYLEVRAIMDKTYDPDSVDRLVNLYNLSLAYRYHKEPDKEAPLLDEIIERASRPGHESWEMLGRALEERAAALDDRGLVTQAIPLRERALVAYDKARDAASHAWTEAGLGNDYRRSRRAAQAVPYLERALAAYEAEKSDPYEEGVVAFWLAQARADAGRIPAAVTAARLAQQQFAIAQSGPNIEAFRSDVAAWLHAHAR